MHQLAGGCIASTLGLGTWRLNGCSSVKEIALPDVDRWPGSSAVFRGSSLRGIALPDTVVAFGDRAFSGCTSLREITLPELAKDYLARPVDCYR